MPYLDQYNGREVFIIGQDETSIVSAEIHVFRTYKELWEHVVQLELSVDYDVRVIHGVLITAEVLPSNLNGTTPYVVMCDINESEMGSVVGKMTEIPAASIAELAEALETIIGDPVQEVTTNVDNMYVLYGYEPHLSIHLDTEELDEGPIALAKPLVDDIMEIQEAYYTEHITSQIDEAFPEEE